MNPKKGEEMAELWREKAIARVGIVGDGRLVCDGHYSAVSCDRCNLREALAELAVVERSRDQYADAQLDMHYKLKVADLELFALRDIATATRELACLAWTEERREMPWRIDDPNDDDCGHCAPCMARKTRWKRGNDV